MGREIVPFRIKGRSLIFQGHDCPCCDGHPSKQEMSRSRRRVETGIIEEQLDERDSPASIEEELNA